MRMIFLFIDGFGIGQESPATNPVYAVETPNLDYILSHSLLFPTDATLGIRGLPQSATGQTTIFTGVNASRVLGRHMHGKPTVTLKGIINDNNLFRELMNLGLRVTYANVYRQEYLDKIEEPKDRRNQPSVTTVMTMSCGLKLRTVEDYNAEKGVYHDITGQVLVESGYDVRMISPDDAARRLYNISRDYDFTMFEHFMTDIIGHKMDMDLAIQEIQLLDAFLGGLIRQMNFDEEILFITSDHGNIEDISVKTHTFNKVPTIIMGNGVCREDISIESLVDITPAVVKLFENTKENRIDDR